MNPLALTLLAKAADVVSKFIPDPTAQAQAQLEILKLADAKENRELSAELQAMQMQADINKVEASNPSLFVSGWRPAVGWVCVVGLSYEFVLNPVLVWLSLNLNWQSPPGLDMGTLITLLLGLLGLGGLRTVEKLQGKAR